MSRTPLAWKNLVHEPRRLLLASAGVGFAAVLMFTQNGFRNALLDSPVQLIEWMDCDLVATSTARYMLPVNQRFPRDLLRRAMSDPAVTAAEPLLIERLMARVRVAGQRARPIRVISVPDQSGWLAIPGLHEQRQKLQPPGTALIDRKTRSQYGFQFDRHGNPLPQIVEVAGKRIHLVGSATIGTDFANEGSLLIRESEFARYFPVRGNGRPLEVVDVGMFQIDEAADPVAVAERLTSLAPDLWKVVRRADLAQKEKKFWSEQTPVGAIFFIGTVMGFVVGVIICYQILYTSLQDAMPEFATLKAMGYPNRYFVGVVVRQAIFLSWFGFVPAVIVTLSLFWALENYSGLPMRLTMDRAATVLVLTTSMCLISGLLALRKLIRADPASLF
ncbi:FtsX-like permease family protein [Allorhodopirellula heiligendammensis]|uniref:FtsX-like permease family protein n=1 Tax=Allorhodopirellula heiligendammensis TaxID=2714739 RepID=A0A5C6C566_9BACT|nr:FtsX-like permease family protein [Allorhodopirellula heiligendammensis]TWU19137.1 FtsX-like permease family protein [Allorhodopirellula heiligendammensis]